MILGFILLKIGFIGYLTNKYDSLELIMQLP